MRKHFYFSAMICMLLSVFVISASADYYQPEQNAWTIQDNKKTDAVNKNMRAIEARSLMQTIGSYYDANVSQINKGKRLTIGSVFSTVTTVSVSYVSGGSTLWAFVPSSISTAVQALNLGASINTGTELESAYESAISELSTRIWETSAAIARYKSAWKAYSLVVSSHNSSNHGSNSSPSDPAHEISKDQPPSLNESLPSFSCPDGSCNLTWSSPSSARTAHYARCGTLDDQYDSWLAGCFDVYYTCNSSEKARHKPKDCGLSKWIQTTHGWTETPCPGDHRKCTHIQRSHSTLLTGMNVTSTCGGSRPSAPSSSTPPSENPAVSPTPTPTPPPTPSPTYHACRVHETSVSGDHSLQASCSSTDGNGNSCTVTNFYACDGHSHSYPSANNNNNGNSGDPGNSGNSGDSGNSDNSGQAEMRRCGQHTKAEGGDHSYNTCSHCGRGYFACSQWAYRHTTQDTCRRPGCGTTFYKCSNGTCTSNWGTRSSHWAQ